MSYKSTSSWSSPNRSGTKTTYRKVLIPADLREVIAEIEDEITGLGRGEKFIGANNAGQMLAEALSNEAVRYVILEYIEHEVYRDA